MTSISTAGGGIKSIQRGTTSPSYNAGTDNVTITAVDMAKTVVTSSCKNGYGNNVAYAGNAILSSCELTSTTNLQVQSGKNVAPSYAENSMLSWQVVEYV